MPVTLGIPTAVLLILSVLHLAEIWYGFGLSESSDTPFLTMLVNGRESWSRHFCGLLAGVGLPCRGLPFSSSSESSIQWLTQLTVKTSS